MGTKPYAQLFNVPTSKCCMFCRTETRLPIPNSFCPYSLCKWFKICPLTEALEKAKSEKKKAEALLSSSTSSIADLGHQLAELQAGFMDAIEEKTFLEAGVKAYEVGRTCGEKSAKGYAEAKS